MMTAATAYRLQVFGAHAENGNPAVVIVRSDELSKAAMQALATKAAVSDTAFVRPEATPNHFRIRWFTPTTEVALCGHATLAAARVLREQHLADGERPIEFHYASGRLVVTQEGERSWLELPLPANTIFDGSRNPIVEVLQIWGSETELKLPLELTPEQDLIIPLSLAADLNAIEPQFDLLASIGRELKVRGFALLSRKKRETASHFALRFFAPHYGIPEDPATGSVVGPLALYALKHGWATRNGNPTRLRFEQGDAIGRPCRLEVEITDDGSGPARLRVGGLTSAPVAQQL
jgi:PhzF family phenazine biosynthesis protein